MNNINREEILLVVALEEESNGKFEKNKLPIIYTGVGKINATYCLTKAIYERKLQNKKTKLVINLGSVGSKTINKREVVLCDGFIQRDMDSTAFGYELGKTAAEMHIPLIIKHKKFLKGVNYGICGTGDNFETGIPKVKCDVVDMEAYALAKVCMFEKIDFVSIKYVTDGADEGAAEDWDKEVKSAGEKLNEYLNKLLTSL
ncbi:5'-nucleosidase [Pseudomonadota bacterium]